MNKRGSHVGVILSFVVFVTFILFLYLVLEPSFETGRNKEAVLDFLKLEIIDKVTANLTTITISGDSSEDCLQINKDEIKLDGLDFIVKDAEGGKVDSTLSGDFLQWETSDEDFYKIYISEEQFKDYTLNPDTCGGSEIKLFKSDQHLFETKIYSFIQDYSIDYEFLKEELKIPIGTEFSFSFTNSSGFINGTEEKNLSTNIYSEELSIQYIDKEANINPGFITIRVW